MKMLLPVLPVVLLLSGCGDGLAQKEQDAAEKKKAFDLKEISEGQAWALENHISTAADCAGVDSSEKFVEGCINAAVQLQMQNLSPPVEIPEQEYLPPAEDE